MVRTQARRPGRKLMEHDRSLDGRIVVGADEAGRGALAGPIVAAAVAFDMESLTGPDGAFTNRLNDSKKLDVDEREDLYWRIMLAAEDVQIRVVSAASIDRDGLHRSNLRALVEAVGSARVDADQLLIDGFDLGRVTCRDGVTRPATRIVKGDATSATIAAASIIAKVHRDMLMRRLDEMTDGCYAFSRHVGYATESHREAIREHGPSMHHRMSFASSAYDGND